MAQSNNDDLYFVPSKEKNAGSQKDSCEEGTGKKSCYHELYTSPGTTVVVQDRKETNAICVMWMSITAVTMPKITSSQWRTIHYT